MNHRLKALAATLREGEAALVLSESNRFYYTRFAADAGALWVTSTEAAFLTDSRYTEAACRVIRDIPVIESDGFFADTVKTLAKKDIRVLLLEDDTLTVAARRRFMKQANGVELVTDSTLRRRIAEARLKKDETELFCIRLAQTITEQGFRYILTRIGEGRTEKEIALELEMYMRQHGAERVAFDFIVASGKNGALPHAVPGDRRLQKGDFVTLDFGAVAKGYRSDMTRTVAIGEVSAEQREVYDTVLRAQEACLRGLRAGMTCAEGDRLARAVIEQAGYGHAFRHSTGHGVGIDIHEAPTMSPRSEDILQAGTVVTVEPGIYLEGRFGVRIEDMVVVTETGIENLTGAPKELLIL